jgi:outer membrane receptor protein involved in Fe transport
VNFILKDDFEGVELDFHTGGTQEGDGEETRFTALLGVNDEDGNGNVMLGVEWYKREGVMAIDRDFFLNGYFDPGSDVTIFPFPHPASYSPVFGGGLPSQAAVDQIFAGVPGYVPCDGQVFANCVVPAGGFKVQNTNEIYFNEDGSPFVVAGARGYNSGFDSPSNMSTAGDGFAGMRLAPNGNLVQNGYTHIASTPLERRSAFGRAVVDMSDNLSAFVQANYSSVEVTNTGGGAFAPAITVWSAPVPRDTRTLPPALVTLLDSRANPAADWTLFRVLDFLGGAIQPVSNTDLFQIMAGLEGSFSNRDWTWEAYVSSGETDTTNFFHHLPSLQRYQQLLRQPNFGETPPGGFTLGRNYVIHCPTGLPIFPSVRATDPDPRCLEGIDSKARALTEVTQNIAEFNLQGGLAEMRSGDLRFAVGLSARENDFRYDPGETNDNVSVYEQPIGIFAGNNTIGSTEVKEVYGELLVPVTQGLELELGYRLSDYDFLDDKVDTYKALFTWRAADAVTFRGGYQAAERAPNTAELFQGPSLLVVPFAPSDPCSYTTTVPWGNVASNPNRLAVQTLCAAIINNSDTNPANDNTSAFGLPGSAQADNFARPAVPFFPLEIEVRQGNSPALQAGVPAVPSIKSESAETFTIGAVFNVGQGLRMSVDLYDIEITDAIDTRNSLYVYEQCFNANGSSNPTLAYTPMCGTIRRNVQTGERAEVDAPYVNSGLIATTGVDFQLTWDKTIGDGSVYVNSLVTYLDTFETQDAAGEPIVENADTLARDGQFEYKLTNTFGYNFGGGRASIGLQWRHLPEIRDESAARNPNTRILSVPAYDTFNLFAGFTIGDRIQLRGGIDNLTDEDPPIVGTRLPGTNGPTDPGDRNAENTRADFYDILGRRAYFGVKMAF